MSLARKLESDSLSGVVTEQVQLLHGLFVSWFQGKAPRAQLQKEVEGLLTPAFSHVAPNGQFLQGRQQLIQQLDDKYSCYQDRTFGIDIYNVQLLWHDSQHCLVTYEEWQFWQQEQVPHQFGRLSTALLARPTSNGNGNGSSRSSSSWQWHHVHETWLEADAPTIRKAPSVRQPPPARNLDTETIMTGPVPRPQSTRGVPAVEDASDSTSPSDPVPASPKSPGSNMVASLEASDSTMETQHKMLLLASAANGGSNMQTQVQSILAEHTIPFESLDGDANRGAREQLCRNIPSGNSYASSGSGSNNNAAWPKIFLVSSRQSAPLYWGTLDRLQSCQRAGTLAAEWQQPLQRPEAGGLQAAAAMAGGAAATTTGLYAAQRHADDNDDDDDDDNDDNANGGDDDASAQFIDLDGLLSLEGDDDGAENQTDGPHGASKNDMSERTDNENAILLLVKRLGGHPTIIKTLDTNSIHYKLVSADVDPGQANDLMQISQEPPSVFPQLFLISPSGVTTYWGTEGDIFDSHANGRLRADLGLTLDASDDEDDDDDDDSSSSDSSSSSGSSSSSKSSTDNGAARNQSTATGSRDIMFKPQRTPNSTLVVLHCSESPSADLLLAQEESILALNAHNIEYEKVDGTTDAKRRQELFRVSQIPDVYPQFFFVDKTNGDTNYWGGLQDFFDAHQNNTIVKELGLPAPSSSASTSSAPSPKSRSVANQRPTPPAVAAAPVPAVSVPTPATEPLAIQGKRILVMTTQQHNQGRSTQDRALAILAQSGLPYETIDGSDPHNRNIRNKLFSISKKWGAYTQFFLKQDDTLNKVTLWGFEERFMESHKNGTLVEDFGFDTNALGAPAPAHKAEMGAGAAVGVAAVAASATSMNQKSREAAAVSPPEKAPERVVERAAPEMGVHEEAFMQASQGILEFEAEDAIALSDDDDDDDDDEDDASSEDMDGNLTKLAAVPSPIPNDVSKKRHVSPKLDKYAKPLTWENALVGLSIAGFDVGTSQGPIGDEVWYKEIGVIMEEKAQSKTTTRPRRKLALPEMVFPAAHVALEGHGLWLSWDVVDALDEWAAAHQEIGIRSTVSNRGVCVMKSKDAALWSSRNNKLTNEDTNGSSSMFHYDWTYSTPFGGKVDGGHWVELDSSGMRQDLLTDQSIPILFFDEVVLFEDDLHDNGQVEYSVKLRVMPSCAYILARLWLRVDNVVVRLRETRTLVDFFGIKPKVYRDITWRECYWKDMATYDLPTSVKSWTYEGAETPAWHGLLKRIPEVSLPKDMHKHAVLGPN